MYRTEIQIMGKARKAASFYVATEPELAFAIRITDSNGVKSHSPKKCCNFFAFTVSSMAPLLNSTSLPLTC